MELSLAPQIFFSKLFFSRSGSVSGSGFHYEIQSKNVMFKALMIPSKFDVVRQSSCENQNPDQDQNFTFDFETGNTFYTQKISTKLPFKSYCIPGRNAQTYEWVLEPTITCLCLHSHESNG